jgi:hypothetical protein
MTSMLTEIRGKANGTLGILLLSWLELDSPKERDVKGVRCNEFQE